MQVIQLLDNEPNDVGGMTAADLKAKFDEGGEAVKEFINNILTAEADAAFATKAEVQSVVLGQIPDGTVTQEKLSTDIPPLLNSHASRHAISGADPLAPGDIGAWTKTETLDTMVAILWGGSSSSLPIDILKYAAARYGTCTTASATAAKGAALDNFVLSVGAVIGVSFTYQNTASSPMLNVNGTGAKAIYFNGAEVGASQLPKMAYLQYDGIYWQILTRTCSHRLRQAPCTTSTRW